MARAIFQTIYDNVKQSIDDGTYAYQSYLPSETELTQLFDCSRMTVRRAISKKTDIKLPKDTLEAIIESYTRESGVRELEKKIGKILRDRKSVV